jgi:two-component system response regulator FixJ
MSNDVTIFIVDDDEQARQSVAALVRSMGFVSQSFSSAEEFLASYIEGTRGCLITDVRMVGMSGIDLLEKLNTRNIFLPVVVLTAYAETPLTVRAIKAGAVTLLEKPYADDALWDAIRKGLAMDAAERGKHEYQKELRRRMERLGDTQRTVMDMVVQGLPNKVIAKRLDVSVRTIENRRHEIFSIMHADSVAELVRMVIEAEAESEAGASE